MTTGLIAIADGTEELEFSGTHDIMVRAGIKVTVVSVMDHKLCVLSHGMKVEASCLISELKDDEIFDVIVCPGGMPGSSHLAGNTRLISMLKAQKSRNSWYAAICAAPALVFHATGITTTELMVCYPSFSESLKKSNNLGSGRVVVCNKCITADGPGSVIAFGLAIAECVAGKDKADQVAKDMLVSR